MKIIEFRAENIKKLKVVTIKPKGHVVKLTGGNGEGKTSTLDSILYCLAGTEQLPSQPIRKGQEKGSIFIDLGEYKVMRKFTASGNVLMVESSNGARYKEPQGLLNKLFGELTFDPLAFTRMKPKDQAFELQRLSKLEVDPNALDEANKADYKVRTDVSREAKALKIQVDAISYVNELPEKPYDLTAMLAEVSEAGLKNGQVHTIETSITQKRNHITETRAAAERLLDQATELMNEVARLRAVADEKYSLADVAEAEVEKIVVPEHIDTAKLVEAINEARAVNAQIEKRTQKEALQAKLDEKEAEVKALTDAMAARITQKEEAIGKAQMPVEGLGFEDGEVFYQGLPFNQASGAEQLRVSMAIAMAGNPECRIIRITDGSLLDDESMEIVKQMAIKRDYQIWIEVVDTSGKVGIVFEDGEIIANHDVADEAPEARGSEAAAATPIAVLKGKAKKGPQPAR